jgi:hypothetical protein
MKLKSFGCSFIFGSDLPDITPEESYNKASQLTWPSLLAQDKNMSYQCHARPGSGNLQILEKILTQATREPAVFVIGWSWIDRFDYTVPTYENFYVHDLASNSDVWKTLMPSHENTVSKIYYRDLHSQYCDKLSALIYIKTAIDTLTQKNLPFIMTCIDDLLFENQWHANSALTDLQNYVQPYITKFDRKNFLNFSKDNGHAISAALHPLETAHYSAFELIKSYNLL